MEQDRLWASVVPDKEGKSEKPFLNNVVYHHLVENTTSGSSTYLNA